MKKSVTISQSVESPVDQEMLLEVATTRFQEVVDSRITNAEERLEHTLGLLIKGLERRLADAVSQNSSMLRQHRSSARVSTGLGSYRYSRNRNSSSSDNQNRNSSVSLGDVTHLDSVNLEDIDEDSVPPERCSTVPAVICNGSQESIWQQRMSMDSGDGSRSMPVSVSRLASDRSDQDIVTSLSSIRSASQYQAGNSESIDSDRAVFMCHPAWECDAVDIANPQQAAKQKTTHLDAMLKSTSDAGKTKITNFGEITRTDPVEEKHKSRCSGICSYLPLHPSAGKRLSWDLCSVACLTADLITIPLYLSFQPTHTDAYIAFNWMTLLFWSTDSVLSFLTGYYEEGKVEMRFVKIAKRYLKGWFLPDITILGIDWLLTISTMTGSNMLGGVGQVHRSLRFMRMARALRLVRLLKLRNILETIEDRIASDYLMVFLSILKLTALVIALNHLIACTWHAIGRSASDGVENWVEAHNFEDVPIEYLYLSSLHWTLTQFTPATMEVHPHNTQERTFAVLVLLFALIVFSSFVSSITAAMTQLRQWKKDESRQFSLLRHWLRNRQVSNVLSIRIKRYLEHVVSEKANQVQEEDVKLLRFLSTPLMMELEGEAYEPVLRKHPLFHQIAEVDSSLIHELCHKALHRFALSQGDVLFTESSASDKMLFVMKGQLCYYLNLELQEEELSENIKMLRPSVKQAAKPMNGSEPNARNTIMFKNQGTDKSGMEAHVNGPNPTLAHSVTRTLEESKAEGGEYDTVREGSWICEDVLWTAWVHVGTAYAETICEILAVDAQRFIQVVTAHKKVQLGVVRYAQDYVSGLNLKADEGSLSDVDKKTWERKRAVQLAFGVEDEPEISFWDGMGKKQLTKNLTSLF